MAKQCPECAGTRFIDRDEEVTGPDGIVIGLQAVVRECGECEGSGFVEDDQEALIDERLQRLAAELEPFYDLKQAIKPMIQAREIELFGLMTSAKVEEIKTPKGRVLRPNTARQEFTVMEGLIKR